MTDTGQSNRINKMIMEYRLENGNPLKCLNITDEELEMLRDKFLGDNTRKLDLK